MVREENNEIYYKAWRKCTMCTAAWISSQVNLAAVRKLNFNKEDAMTDQIPGGETAKEEDPLHPEDRGILKHFKYDHLPKNLQAIYQPVCELAHIMAHVGSGPELTAGLRKLLEAKDCFVRSAIDNGR